MSKLEFIRNANSINYEVGDRIRLIDGKNVPLKGRESYDWVHFEEISRIEGEMILFNNHPSSTWFTTGMAWEVEKRN